MICDLCFPFLQRNIIRYQMMDLVLYPLSLLFCYPHMLLALHKLEVFQIRFDVWIIIAFKSDVFIKSFIIRYYLIIRY